MKRIKVIIVGGGLAGLTAALYLADSDVDIVILEQGKDYSIRTPERLEDTLVGLGGAGTISGGKLCFPPASGGIWKKTHGEMENFASFCGSAFSSAETILALPSRKQVQHTEGIIQKDYRTEIILKSSMNELVNNILHKLMSTGVSIRCGCRVKELSYLNGSRTVIFTNEVGENEYSVANYVLIATGRTSTPFLTKLFGENISHQPDLGIRLSMNTKQPAFFTYGEDVKLKRITSDYIVRTFCVCCGGGSIKTLTHGYVHFDGHFGDSLTDVANIGIMARSSRYSGIETADNYLNSMQKYLDSDISLKDFIKYNHMLSKDTVYDQLFNALSSFISDLYKSSLLVQNPDEIQVMLPAVDNLNPLIDTNSGFESRFPHVYVLGDAAGVSRGFIQSMWSGYCAAKRISEEIICPGQTLAM